MGRHAHSIVMCQGRTDSHSAQEKREIGQTARWQIEAAETASITPRAASESLVIALQILAQRTQ